MRAQTDIELTERLVETPTFNRFALAGSCAKEEAVLVLESAVFAIESELVLPFLLCPSVSIPLARLRTLREKFALRIVWISR
jgi:hypothetical protein